MEMCSEIEVSEEGVTFREKYFKKVRAAGQKSKKSLITLSLKKT